MILVSRCPPHFSKACLEVISHTVVLQVCLPTCLSLPREAQKDIPTLTARTCHKAPLLSWAARRISKLPYREVRRHGEVPHSYDRSEEKLLHWIRSLAPSFKNILTSQLEAPWIFLISTHEDLGQISCILLSERSWRRELQELVTQWGKRNTTGLSLSFVIIGSLYKLKHGHVCNWWRSVNNNIFFWPLYCSVNNSAPFVCRGTLMTMAIIFLWKTLGIYFLF